MNINLDYPLLFIVLAALASYFHLIYHIYIYIHTDYVLKSFRKLGPVHIESLIKQWSRAD
jgi:hypothetical protein